MREQAQRGIPDCIRGVIWQKILGSEDEIEKNPRKYEVRKAISNF